MNTENNTRKKKLSVTDQIAYMRDVTGIQFNIISEDQALHFLETSNYYFRIKSYAKNYPKYTNGENAGKYYDLEFAYLQELSTLDMYLRQSILMLSISIEHYLKVHLIRDISNNPLEDGYSIVADFLNNFPFVLDTINSKAHNSYCENLISKYSSDFSVWTIVEVLSFGDLINLCDLYYSKYPSNIINIGNLRTVKFLRNAAAHNNCLMNDLSPDNSGSFKQNRYANTFVSSISGISAKVQSKKMHNRTIHDIVVLLCCFKDIVTSEGVKKYQIREFKTLVDVRFVEHKEYFKDNAMLVSSYDFIKKIIDKIADVCI